MVEEHAFKLKVGELSPIIGAGDKFIVLRCIGRTKQVVEQMTPQVRDELVKDLHEKKLRLAMTQEFDRLKEVAQIDNFLAGTSQAGRRAATGTEGAITGSIGKAPGTIQPVPPRTGTVPPTAAAPQSAKPIR
jgi:hypothetical protein